MLVEGDVKTVYVGNANKHYVLFCNVKADAGCTTPTPHKNYLLFDKNTRRKMPGATTFLTLALVQDWTVKYNEGESIALVPEQSDRRDLDEVGMFLLDKTGRL